MTQSLEQYLKWERDTKMNEQNDLCNCLYQDGDSCFIKTRYQFLHHGVITFNMSKAV